jgi:hypothetical protein
MKKQISLWIAVAMLGLAAGCGAKEDSLKYDFTENGCGTGEHEFDSQENYCSGLKSRSLNKGCAYSLREEAFKSNGCPGPWKETD